MADIDKTIEGLQRLRFFNQRAGRELWGDKPEDVQNMDIETADSVYGDALEIVMKMKSTIEILETMIEKRSKVLDSKSDCEDLAYRRGDEYVARRDGKVIGLEIALSIIKG